MATKKYPHYRLSEDPQRPGSWRASITLAPGAVLQRRAPSREAAEAKAKELIKRHEAQLNVAGADMALSAFVNVWWERTVVPRELAPKTKLDYRGTLERYVLPEIGELKLSAIDALVVVDLAHTLTRTYSQAVATRAITKLHMVLEAARRWRYLSYNPAADARADLRPYRPAARQPLQLAEVKQLLRAAEGHRLASLYHMAVLLGLRLGELLGLQWGDVDWAARTITVRRQAQDINGRTTVREATKTAAGLRTLPLPPRLSARLRAAWAAGPQGLFIFPNDEGGMLSPAGFTRHFRGGLSRTDRNGTRRQIRGMRQKAGLGAHVTPHLLRHTCATLLLEMGVAEEVRAALLGHGAKTITQYYSHATMAAMRRAVDQLEAGIYGEELGTGMGTKVGAQK